MIEMMRSRHREPSVHDREQCLEWNVFHTERGELEIAHSYFYSHILLSVTVNSLYPQGLSRSGLACRDFTLLVHVAGFCIKDLRQRHGVMRL